MPPPSYDILLSDDDDDANLPSQTPIEVDDEELSKLDEVLDLLTKNSLTDTRNVDDRKK